MYKFTAMGYFFGTELIKSIKEERDFYQKIINEYEQQKEFYKNTFDEKSYARYQQELGALKKLKRSTTMDNVGWGIFDLIFAKVVSRGRWK